MNAPNQSDQSAEHPCDLCGAREPVELPRCRAYTGGQPIHVCTRCGFVYVVRRRSAERIAQAWSQEIFGSGYTAAIPAVTARLTYVAEFLQLHVDLKGKRVCEIGAGEGAFLRMIQSPSYGATPFGVEPSADNSRQLAAAGIKVFNGTVEQFAEQSFAGESPFDVVAVLWTLENCQDCRRMIALAHDILKPGGSLIVATGSRLLVPFKKPLHNYLSRNPVDTHCFRFSANTLQGLLAVSGFGHAVVNRYLDHDILSVIAAKGDGRPSSDWPRDNYLDVCNFFERWHVETATYFPLIPE